jgi:hypothetical protein
MPHVATPNELAFPVGAVGEGRRHRAPDLVHLRQPGETPEQMFQTLEMVDKIKPTQNSACIFYPFQKTKMYDMCVKTGYLDAEGEEKVRQGISGYHHESILKHPHKELAETLAKVTPICARARPCSRSRSCGG